MKARLLGVIAFLAVAGMATATVFAAGASEEVWVDCAVNTGLAKLGVPFDMVLTAGARRGLVFLPGRDIHLPGCRVLRYREENVSRKHEGYFAKQGIYRLAAFAIPEVIIPRLTVRVLWSAGRSTEIQSLPRTIAIQSMRPEAGLALIDPRPPRREPRPWLVIAGLSVFTGAGAWWGLAQLAARRRGRPNRLPAPHVEAYKALEKLEDRGSQDMRLYFFELSRIFRRYLGRRYGFPALEQSRIRILQQLEQAIPEPKQRQLINQLLAESDLVKFAQAPVDHERMQEAMDLCREIIDMTRERPAVREAVS